MKKKLCRLCVMLLLLLGAVVSLVPFYWLVRSSFMTMMEIYIMPAAAVVPFDHAGKPEDRLLCGCSLLPLCA